MEMVADPLDPCVMVIDVVDAGPISFVSRAANCSARFWKPTNSVVQTGVKSPGWLKNTNQCPANSLGSVIVPVVVVSSIVGNVSVMSNYMLVSSGCDR